MFKKGAMFGLDARIALAIFGALSVISGAALYSAIQEARVTAILTDMTELAKSYESYLLDTGEYLPVSGGSSTHDLDAEELLSSAKSGWKGPYTPYSLQNAGSSDVILDHPTYNYIYLRQTAADDFGSLSDWSDAACSTGNMCYVYVLLRGISDNSIINALDIKVDGVAGEDSGKLRVHTSATLEKRPALLFMSYKY
tara:strand:- start:425 stop:1015 length:591 start_codon:yes stop_codon:yes gene_type:complete